MVAKAMPCGNTTTAPVRPAMKSFCRLRRLTSGSHCKKGSNLIKKSFIDRLSLIVATSINVALLGQEIMPVC